jgi:hypothetical protein
MSKAKKPAKKPVAKAAPKKVAKTVKKVIAKAKPKTAKKVVPKKVEKTAKKVVAKAAPKKTESKLKENKKTVVAKKDSIISKVAKVAKNAVKEAVKKVAVTPAAKEKELKQNKKEKLDKELKTKAAKDDPKAKKKKSLMDDEDGEDEILEDEDFDGSDDDEFFDEKPSKKSKKMELEDDDDFSEEALYKESMKIPSGRAKEIVELEDKIHTEIATLREHFNWKDIADSIATLDFFVNQKTDECAEKGCDNLKTSQNYCRLHYVTNWYSIQKKREILKEGKLQEYIEELISKYPPKYIQAIVSDLSDDKEFYKALTELNISSEFDFEEEEFEADAEADDADDEIIEARYTGGGVRYEEDN